MIEPGTVCEACGRRVNKPKLPTSPDTRVVSIGRLPLERQALLDEAMDGLMHVTGAVHLSYPKGTLLEALCVLGGIHREELKLLFERDPA